MREHRVCIIGAGPAGCTAALHLDRLGIPSVLIDKSTFPRGKTCGDALSGKVFTILKRIDPEIYQRFLALNKHKDIWGIRMITPNKSALDLPFTWNYDPVKDQAPGAVLPRYDFDQFLIEEVRKSPHIDFREGLAIGGLERREGVFFLRDDEGELVLTSKLLLVANGANSRFTRQLAGIRKDNRYYAGAVRAYYENVKGFHPDGFIELHFLKEYIPGYFWVFPMKGNRANVGLGLSSDHVSKKKINLRKSLEDIVEHYPGIRERFAEAKQISGVQGHPLPLGSKRYRISGDGFMLLGDAGHLIDPLTGEGVGHALYSGWIAAEQVERCLEHNRFDAEELLNYDKRIQRVIGAEMRLSYQMQRLMRFVPLVNAVTRRIGSSEKLQVFISRMYSDLELRKKLVNPLFLLKMLMGRGFK
jgi:geranylgeranyl reductase family protein